MDERNWRALHSELDHNDMYGNILQFSSMIRRAVQISSGIRASHADDLKSVVFCGMGGSGMGPELVKAWLINEASVPIEVVRDYHLPGYASSDTLVCVVSYSGNTEEAVSCMRDAVKRKAKLLSVSSNGEIGHLSSEFGTPHVKVPAGLTPRSALPYLFTPLVKLLQASGVISPQRMTELEESIMPVEKVLDEVKIDVPIERNEAKSLAEKLFGKFPVVYGHGVLSGVALRFRQQLNENAKVLASTNTFPELDHNELEGARFVTNEGSVVVLLRSRFESDLIRSKIEASKELLGSGRRMVLELRAQANTAIAEALSLIAMLDMASLYLALLNGVDPSDTPRISALKEKLGSKI